MGRAKGNTKRRPKGKRGWRKIDVSTSLKPTIPLSLEEEKTKISKLRDSQLYYSDTKPRKVKKKLTKKQIKLRAKRKLLRNGFTINSIHSARSSISKNKSYDHKQRLFKWKQSQNPSNNPNPQPKQTHILKFKNKTTKKIQLNNSKNMTLNTKNLKNTTDYHKNNPFHTYKLTHGNKNTKNLPIKDLWDNNNKKSNDNSSNSFNPKHMISHQKKACSSHLTNSKGAPNPYIANGNLISLPHSGESINPMKHQFYYLKWKALQLKAKQIFQREYQKESTVQWYKEVLSTDEHVDATIQKLKQEANQMKQLYLKHLRLWRNGQGKQKGEIKLEREISDREKMKDVKGNKKLKNERRKLRLSFTNGKRIYGNKYRFKQRITKSMKGYKIGKCLRNTLHSGTDHPLSFMFNEMQKQNKIHGHKRPRFIFPKKKGFLGPRYKVQTRIGKLHHANIDSKIFEGIDD